MLCTLGRFCAALALLLGSAAGPSAGQSPTSAPIIQSATGASGFAGAGLAQGAWIEVHGLNLAASTRTWDAADFTDGMAPVSLDGVTVTVGGEAAFVAYISPSQVNALLPSDAPLGQQSLVVANGALASARFPIVVKQTAPGLWTPSVFQVAAAQYAGAVFPDLTTFVLPVGAVPGVASRPAAPGETVILFGTGFGAVTPSVPAGQVVAQATQLNTPVQITLGSATVTPAFAGLAPNQTGVYQFNVKIPAGVPEGAAPLGLTLGGTGVALGNDVRIALTGTPALQLTGVRDLAGNAGTAVPGGMLLVDGTGFGAAPATAIYPLPAQLAGIHADFEGYPAPIARVGPEEIEVQVPWELLGRTSATLTVASATAANGSITVALAPAAPAVASSAYGFSIQIEGSGGMTPVPASSNSRPVVAGEYLDIPAVGLGILKDAPGDGLAASSSNPGNPSSGVMVKIGDAWAPVSGAALMPGGAGVSLVRVQVPINAPVGDAVPLVIEAWGKDSAPVAIAVGSPPSPAFQVQPPDGTLASTATSRYALSLAGGVAASAVNWSAEGMNAPLPETVTSPQLFSTTAGGVTYAGPGNTYLPEYMLIRATLKANQNLFATARVLVTEGTPGFHIAPRNAVIRSSDTVTFQALDDSGNRVDAIWYFSGAYSSSNAYQPRPDAVDNSPVWVRAVGSGGADQTLLYVVAETPKITGISPPNPSPGDLMIISTSGLQVAHVTVYLSRQDGSRIGVAGVNGNNQVGVLVPPGAVEGPIEIDGQPVNSAAVRTPPFQAAISPKLRLRPNQTAIAQGESTAIAVAFLFDTRQRPLNWTTTIGSVDATGRFTAPASVSQTEYARISACLTDRNVCGWTAIAVQPFRVEPAQPMVTAGGTLSLRGMANGAAIPMTWQALGANATVDANGVVHASAGPLDGGVARVKATNSAGFSRLIDIAITATAGGVAGIARDLLNWANGIPFGPGYQKIATIGNRAYVLCTNMPDPNGRSIPGYDATWLDTWDVTDPVNPHWLGSTGLPIPRLGASLMNLGDKLLVAGGWTTTVGSYGASGSIALIYDIPNGIPVLSGFSTVPDYTYIYKLPKVANGHLGYTIAGTDVLQWDLGTLAPPRALGLQLSAAYSQYPGNAAVAGDGRRLYLVYGQAWGSDPWQLTIYDLTVSPPALLTTLTIPPAGSPDLGIVENLLLCGTDVYSLDGGNPALAAHLPSGTIVDSDSVRKRVLDNAATGVRVVDLADPHNPRVSAATSFLKPLRGILIGPDPPSMALAPGDGFFVSNDELESYSVVWTGGPELLATFDSGPGINSGQSSRGNLAFLAESDDPRIFKVYDLTNKTSPQLIGHYDDGTQSADALQLSGDYAFLQCDNDFVVLDISNPAAPAKVASLRVSGVSLALSGNRVIVGAFQGNRPVLTTIDVTKPTAPVILRSIPLENPAYGLALNGNTLAVATGSTGLYLYDVSNPPTPLKLWNATDGAAAWSVAWSGNLLFTASGTNGLIVRDATNPRAPVALGSNSLAEFQFRYVGCCVYQPEAVSVYVSSGVAWVGTTDSYASVFGVDVRDAANPRAITLIRLGNGIDNVVTSIGPVGNDLLVGGNYLLYPSMNLISISPHGNVILPALPQTTASDFSPPLQLTPVQPNGVSGAKPDAAPRRGQRFFEHKLRHIPEPFRERELKRLRDRWQMPAGFR